MAPTRRYKPPSGEPEAVHQDVPLRLVHVISAAHAPMNSDDAHRAEKRYAESSLRDACLAVQATGLPVKIRTKVLYGDIESALIGESTCATLICIGSVGIGRVGAAILGSTAQMLADRAECPVAVIRCDHGRPLAESGFIVAVLNGRHDDEATMCWAMEEARVRRASVLALGVWPWPLLDIDEEEFYCRLDKWIHRYPDVYVDVATTRLSPQRYLEGFIGALQLVVVGAENAGETAALVGPHNLPILAHAECSVLVARDPNHSPISHHSHHHRSPDMERIAR